MQIECKPCRSIRSKARYVDKRSDILATQAAYRAAHPERRQATKRRWYDDHKEHYRGYVRKRRATLRSVENTLTTDEWLEILRTHDRKCVYCGTTNDITQDHVIPLARSGAHTKDNVVPACRSCNCRKQARDLPLALAS